MHRTKGRASRGKRKQLRGEKGGTGGVQDVPLNGDVVTKEMGKGESITKTSHGRTDREEQ